MDDAYALGARARRFFSGTFVLRVIAFLTVYLLAVIGFSAGVGASERDLAAMGLIEHAYYALGLFVLGGLDIGTPVGGPAVARALVWVSYFAAPTITTFAIVESVLRIFGPLGARLRPLSGHIVIAGAGRLSAQYVRELRRRNTRRPVVIVERQSSGSYQGELNRAHGVVVVQGDIASDRVLDELRLSRAYRVLLFTNDDFANLDAAAKIIRKAPGLAGRVVVHVADLRFMQKTSGSSVGRHCEIFNGHEAAARHLVEDQLVAHFRDTPGRDPVVLAGFGRFGRTVLDQLQRLAPGRFGPVVIVDHEATPNVRIFEDGPGLVGDYDVEVIDGDARDPAVLGRVYDVIRPIGTPPVFVFGSASDGTNLQAALSVRRELPDAYIVVRGFRASPFTEEVAQDACLHAVNLGQLVRDGMPDRWF